MPTDYPFLNRTLSTRSVQSEGLELRARALQDREMIAQQRAAIQQQELELRKVQALTTLQQQEQRIRDTMERQRQTMKATKALGEMDPHDPNWERNLSTVLYTYPMASTDEFIKKKVDFLYSTAKAREAQKIKMQEQVGAYEAQHGIKVPMGQDGTPDWAQADQMVADRKSGRQWTNAQLVPEGLEPSKFKVTASGDVEQEFERPRTGQPGTTKQGDSLKSFEADLKGFNLMPGDFENPSSWKLNKTGQMEYQVKDKSGASSAIQLSPDHYQTFQNRFSALMHPQQQQAQTPPGNAAPNTSRPPLDSFFQ